MKIIITKGCRSDDFILPLIKALEADPFFSVNRLNLVPANFGASFEIMEHACYAWKPDLVFITGDRVEQAGACNAIFLNNIPIAHLGAGVINDIGNNWDDVLRHNITSMAEIALCEDNISRNNTEKLWNAIGKISRKDDYYWRNIHVIGNPYADGLNNIDTSLCPDEPYDLILINYETINSDVENYEMYKQAVDSVKEKVAIYIGGNPDGRFGGTYITNDTLKYYDNLPRPKYLGLLKNCSHFISNSSSIYYEAFPLGLKEEQIILIGKRNLNRSTPTDLEGGSTEKILKILKDWWEKKYENI